MIDIKKTSLTPPAKKPTPAPLPKSTLLTSDTNTEIWWPVINQYQPTCADIDTYSYLWIDTYAFCLRQPLRTDHNDSMPTIARPNATNAIASCY